MTLALDVQAILAGAASGGPGDGGRSAREDRAREARDVLVALVPMGLLEGRTAGIALASLPASLASVPRWAWGDGSLLVVGRSGAGKSTAALLLVHRLLQCWVRTGSRDDARALRVAWWRARALGREVQATRYGVTCQALEAAIKAPILVLDDLGWEHDPAMVGDLLCERIDQGRPSVVTSGQTVDALELRYGQPVLRRLLERGRAVEAWS